MHGTIRSNRTDHRPAGTNPYFQRDYRVKPQKPEDNWPNFTEEDLLTYVRRIGNLTLMKTKENNDFKSSGFLNKKKKYKDSGFWITKSLKEYDEWTKEKIAQRQKELSEIAVETWSLKF